LVMADSFSLVFAQRIGEPVTGSLNPTYLIGFSENLQKGGARCQTGISKPSEAFSPSIAPGTNGLLPGRRGLRRRGRRRQAGPGAGSDIGAPQRREGLDFGIVSIHSLVFLGFRVRAHARSSQLTKLVPFGAMVTESGSKQLRCDTRRVDRVTSGSMSGR
jgi:hypothetical protein